MWSLTEVLSAEAHGSGLGETIGSGGFAIAVIGACLLLCTTPSGGMTVVGWATLPLRATGAMPLTATQLLLEVWAGAASNLLGVFSDLGGFCDLDPFWPMTLGIVAL